MMVMMMMATMIFYSDDDSLCFLYSDRQVNHTITLLAGKT